ncbi:flavodoxin domain-containing protein [Geodermatophilus sp. SYSU D01186]
MTTPRVLVGYATAAGSTRGIAERIAAGLTDVADVTVVPVGPDVDPAGFDAFVIGSAVHDMAWLPAAADFLRRGRAVLGERPFWCFSVAGVAPSGPLSRALVGSEVRRIGATFPSGLVPRDHRVFGGIVVLQGMPLWGRLFWRAVGGRPGDHRDWPAVDRWAGEVAAALRGLHRDRTAAGPVRPPAV